MTDRQAFIAAICADPDDDLPRLVFADWLDENGEPERAEFIRVQCELAGHEAEREASGKSGWRTKKLRTRVEFLRLRQFELLQPEWCPAVMPYDVRRVSHPPLRVELILGESVRSKWFFTRGFVSAVACTDLDWIGSADLLTRSCLPTAQPLTDVCLTETTLGTLDFAYSCFRFGTSEPYLESPYWPRIRFWRGATPEFPTHALPLQAAPVSPVSTGPGVPTLPRR